jgi:hypothetical protein
MEETMKRDYRAGSVETIDEDALRDAIETAGTVDTGSAQTTMDSFYHDMRSDAAYKGHLTRLENELKKARRGKKAVRGGKRRFSREEREVLAFGFTLGALIAAGGAGIAAFDTLYYDSVQHTSSTVQTEQKQPDYKKGFEFNGKQYKVVKSPTGVYRGW